jgi:hypothetical protein
MHRLTLVFYVHSLIGKISDSKPEAPGSWPGGRVKYGDPAWIEIDNEEHIKV